MLTDLNDDYVKKIGRKHLGLRTIPHPASTGYTYTLIFSIVSCSAETLLQTPCSIAMRASCRPYLYPSILTGLQKPEQGWKQVKKNTGRHSSLYVLNIKDS